MISVWITKWKAVEGGRISTSWGKLRSTSALVYDVPEVRAL